MNRLTKLILISLTSLILSACGGGGGGGDAITYTIGGTVTSLEGTGLVLQNNGGDNLTISANGDFTFVTALDDGADYSVTVLTQPSSPSQTCAIVNGSGTLAGSNITNVSVICVTNTYTVGGSVTGLSGSGLVLQNNGADDLSITADGNFIFAAALKDGTGYSVTVLTQPGLPNQTCAVTDASGTLAGSNVTNVFVACITNTYTVGGSVTGLSGSGLVLQNNLGDDLSITADGDFTFATALDDGTDYSVTVLTQPSSPSQTCTIVNGSGTLAGSNITNVTVSCITYSIGGAVSSLTGTGLVLQNNGTDDLSIATGGSFVFTTTVDNGTNYSATVLTQPTGQYCDISNGSGTVAGADVTNISVECAQAYTNASLSGDYLFTTTEIHDPGTGIEYCGLSGTLRFNGAGNLQVPTGTKRCSNASGITTTDISGAAFTYNVSADGSFTFGSPPTHGQIVLDGGSLLLDGTMKGNDPSDFIDRGVVMKRVTAGSPPTYTDASLNGGYLFNFTEIYESTTYCNEAGTLSFDGAGTTLVGDGTMRCSDGTTVTTTPSSDTLDYNVASDGNFTLGSVEPLHGQITLDGNSMLLDTSLMVSGGAHLMDLVAMKRVTAGLPPTYSNTSLKGNYLFNFTEVYNPGTTTYCDQAGTLSFDGAGTARGNGTQRCTDGTTVTTTAFSDTLDYDVNPDGSFTLGGLVEPLHGQIALDGSSLLLDGTLKGDSASIYINQGIAMKRVAKEFIGTWAICRDEDPFDEKEIHTADGTSGTATSYLYTSTDGSCSTGESFNGSVDFTYTTGGMITTTLSGTSVNAVTIDATFPGEGTFYQIFYINNSTAPDNLYMGDETADPLLDGSTAAKRPIALQETLPRLRQ